MQGCDIRDVVHVIQYGVPDSLSVWIQRAGRAGRDPNIQARAALIAEKSLFGAAEVEIDADEEDEDTEEVIINEAGSGLVDAVPGLAAAAEVELAQEIATAAAPVKRSEVDDRLEETVGAGTKGKRRVKRVEPGLFSYITDGACRRAICDGIFDNPARLTPSGVRLNNGIPSSMLTAYSGPKASCCDRCALREAGIDEVPAPAASPVSTTQIKEEEDFPRDESQSAAAKKPRKTVHPRRQGDFLRDARDLLTTWRRKIWQRDSVILPPTSIMSDTLLSALATKQKIHCPDDIEPATGIRWNNLAMYGAEVTAALKELDEQERERRIAERKFKAAEKRKAAEESKRAEEAKRVRTEAERRPFRPSQPQQSASWAPSFCNEYMRIVVPS